MVATVLEAERFGADASKLERTGADSGHNAGAVTAWGARIPRVHAQNVEHVPKVEANGPHCHLHPSTTHFSPLICLHF